MKINISYHDTLDHGTPGSSYKYLMFGYFPIINISYQQWSTERGTVSAFGRKLDLKTKQKCFCRSQKLTERGILAGRALFRRKLLHFDRFLCLKNAETWEFLPEIRQFRQKCPSFGQFLLSAEIAILRFSSFDFGQNCFGRSQVTRATQKYLKYSYFHYDLHQLPQYPQYNL